jgi:hypothetical protein
MNEENNKNITMKCQPMRVKVPATVNVKELVKGLCLSPTRSENLKNKIYYFLSRIVSTNENYKLYEKSDGYRNISSVIMRKVMGRADYYEILNLLTNPIDPIIESNNSWLNSPSEGLTGYCKGYRITQKYNTGEVHYKTIPNKYYHRILKHVPEEKLAPILSDKYKFLLNQFQQNTLSFNPRVFEYIRAFGKELLSRVEDNNEFQTKMVYNLIGRWIYCVKRIEDKDLWYKVSPDNHRLNSSLTNLKRTLRPFLLCNGKPLAMIDISSSQPYFLSSAMSSSFMSGTGDGFNLKSIYPEVYEELVSKGFIYNTYSGNTYTYSNSESISASIYPLNNTFYYSSPDNFYGNINSSASVQSISILNSNSSNTLFPSFMWGQFFEKNDIESIIRYQQSPFDSDFYKSLIQTYQTYSGQVDDNYSEQRQKLKDTMMFILFDNNWKHRNNNEIIRMFQMVFPGVDKWISGIHKIIGNGRFAYLLQRTESYLVLDVVCREFHEKFPSVPAFTIHDAVYTYKEYIPDLKELILGRFHQITGVKVGVKTSSVKIDPEPKLVDIDHEWDKIKSIKTLKNFKKVNHGVFISNIKIGAEFLNEQRIDEEEL